METLSVNFRTDIAFYENGPSGPNNLRTYLLLHGLGNSMNFWIDVAPSLAKFSRTIAIDLPGFGKSATPIGGFTLEHATAAIANFCDQEDVRNCVLVAHSLGAFIALDLANRSAPRFTNVILVDGTLTRAAELIQNPMSIAHEPVLGFYVAAQFLGGMIPLGPFFAKLVSRNRLIRKAALWPYVANPENLDPRMLAMALASNGGRNVLKVLLEAHTLQYIELMRAVPQQVDLVWGAEDHLINGTDIDAARGNMRVRRLEKLPGIGHWPMLERPELLTEILLSCCP